MSECERGRGQDAQQNGLKSLHGFIVFRRTTPPLSPPLWLPAATVPSCSLFNQELCQGYLLKPPQVNQTRRLDVHKSKVPYSSKNMYEQEWNSSRNARQFTRKQTQEKSSKECNTRCPKNCDVICISVVYVELLRPLLHAEQWPRSALPPPPSQRFKNHSPCNQ